MGREDVGVCPLKTLELSLGSSQSASSPTHTTGRAAAGKEWDQHSLALTTKDHSPWPPRSGAGLTLPGPRVPPHGVCEGRSQLRVGGASSVGSSVRMDICIAYVLTPAMSTQTQAL